MEQAKPQAIVIRHTPYEGLGTFEHMIRAYNFAIRYYDAGHDNLQAIDPKTPGILLTLGGAISAYDDAKHPFIKDEIKLLRERIALNRPTFGICLGAQMMARAMGASVYAAPRKEIGWKALTLTEEGKISCIQHVAPDAAVMHWHGDIFDLPPHAVRLASTDLCPNQAFKIGSNILGVQFHPEVSPLQLEKWFAANAREMVAEKVDAAQLRADTARFGPALVDRGAQCLSAWLDGLKPV